MLKAERQDAIISLCNERRSLTVREAAKALGVSDMTARRDFDELAEQGRIARVYGGARSVFDSKAAGPLEEVTHRSRPGGRRSEKEHVARLAAGLVKKGDAIYLGSGSTIETMVGLLPRTRLRITTASLSVFGLVVDSEAYDSGLYELHLLGGKYDRTTMMFDSPQTYAMIASYGFDRAFESAIGIMDGIVYGHSATAGYTVRLAFGASRESYLIADSSKIGKRDRDGYCSLREVDALVTDDGITAEQRAEVERYTKVIC